MEYGYLGKTGLKVSKICLGTMNFGPHTDEHNAHQIMDAAHEVGINFFDTANVYGGPGKDGYSEEIIGRWFAKGGGRRDKTVLATKLYSKMGDWPNHSRISALAIRRECDASLKRLKTDYIDLLQMHHIYRQAPWEEVWQAMEQLVQSGKILYVGSSNFAAWHIVQANEAARKRNFLGLISEQSLYNLTARMIELEVQPACAAYGVGLIPWSPLAGGLLGGILGGAGDRKRRLREAVQEDLRRLQPQIERYEALCHQLGEGPAHVAQAWLLGREAVASVISGPRTVEQLHSSLRALSLTLDNEVLGMLDNIFPGPGGPAPEAYAW